MLYFKFSRNWIALFIKIWLWFVDSNCTTLIFLFLGTDKIRRRKEQNLHHSIGGSESSTGGPAPITDEELDTTAEDGTASKSGDENSDGETLIRKRGLITDNADTEVVQTILKGMKSFY